MLKNSKKHTAQTVDRIIGAGNKLVVYNTKPFNGFSKELLGTNTFPMLPFKDIIALYIALTKQHEDVRYFILEHITRALSSPWGVNLKEQQKLANHYFFSTNHSKIKRLPKKIRTAAIDVIKIRHTSPEDEIYASQFLIGLTAQPFLDIPSEIFERWWDSFMAADIQRFGANTATHHSDAFKNSQDVSSHLVIRLLNPEQIQRCYQRTIAIITTGKRNKTLVAALQALRGILSVSPPREENQKALIKCLENYQPDDHNTTTIRFEILAICSDHLSNKVLVAEICKMNIRNLQPACPPTSNLLSYTLERLMNFRYGLSSADMLIRKNWPFIAKCLLAEDAQQIWGHFTRYIRTQRSKNDDYNTRGMIEHFLEFLLPLAHQISDKIKEDWVSEMIDYFTSARYLYYTSIVAFCAALEKGLPYNHMNIQDLFDYLLTKLKNLTRPENCTDLFNAIIAVLPYIEKKQEKTDQLYDLMQKYTHISEPAEISRSVRLAPFFDEEKRLAIFEEKISNFQDNETTFNLAQLCACLPCMSSERIKEKKIIHIIFSQINYTKSNPYHKNMICRIFPSLMPHVAEDDLPLLRNHYEAISKVLGHEDTLLTTNEIIAIASVFQFYSQHFTPDTRLLRTLFTCAFRNTHALNLLCQLIIQGYENVQTYFEEHHTKDYKEGQPWCIILHQVIQGCADIPKETSEVKNTDIITDAIIDDDYYSASMSIK